MGDAFGPQSPQDPLLDESGQTSDLKEVEENVDVGVGVLGGTVAEIQRAIGVKIDGVWGNKTDAKFIQLRRRYLTR